VTARRLPRLAPGDRVRYSSEFCRTIGAVTGWTPQARGVITRLWGRGAEFAAIRWDHPGPGGDPEGGAHLSALKRCR
jgi:hypothetical protein